jgi:glycyl-tRNA synthetase (class II)
MRDSMEQKRMKISDLDSVLSEYIAYPWLIRK